MKKIIILFFVIFGWLQTGYTQSPTADFSLPLTACRAQSITPVNTSLDATAYEWDFCLKDAETLTSQEELAVIPGLSGGYGYKLIDDNGEWFGFVSSENNHTLYRLDFGSSPTNTPLVTNLGNPGGLLVFPEGIEVVRNNGKWFAFIGSFNTNHGIIRLDFGPSLENNSPTAQNLGNFGFSTRFRALKVVHHNTDNVLVLAAYNLNAIVRINYRDSFENTIGPEDIFDSGAIAGLGNPLGMDITRDTSGEIIMLVASYNGNSITQLNFGSDILMDPGLESTYTFPEVAKPYFIEFIQEGSQYYAVVSNESLPITVLDFNDLDPASPPLVVPHGGLPIAGGIEAFRSQGKSFIHATGTSNNQLRQLTFESPCDGSVSFSSGENPEAVKYSESGTKNIELRAYNANGGMSLQARQVVVSNQVSPDISFTSTNVCVNHAVNFISQNISEDIATYEWHFGDMTQSSLADPAHEFTGTGEYKVSLLVSADNGCENVVSENVKIYPEPAAEFTLPLNLLCTNNEFTFSNNTSETPDGYLTYQWLVDQNPVSTDRDLKYTFTTAGAKEIKLVAAIPGCSDEIIKTTSTVEPGPVVDFSYTGTCEEETFFFQSSVSEPVETYSWHFGNGQTSETENPSNVFPGFGNFSISLATVNTLGCENVKTKTINIHSKPSVGFTVDGPPNACAGTETAFHNLTTNPDGREITGWLWYFDDPNNLTPESESDPQHDFAVAGPYHVSLTSTTESGCEATMQKQITIIQSPSTTFTFTPACDDLPVVFTGPSGDIVEWYWEIGNAFYPDRSPTHTFKAPGEYNLYLEVTGTSGCVSRLHQRIHVPAPLTPDFSVLKNCVDQQAVFTDITSGLDPIISREWNFNDGEVFTLSPVSYTFRDPGNTTVWLDVTTQSGCSYHVSRQVEILSAPQAGFSADPVAGGYPLEVAFMNTSSYATQYVWRFSDGTGSTSTDVSPVYTFQGPGSHRVELTAYNEQQCEDTSQAIISTVAPLPDAAVEMISLSLNPDGSSRLIVTIHNKGNTYLKDLPVDVDFGGGLSLRQIVEQSILPGTKHNLVLSTGIQNPESMRYLCVSLDLPNDVNEEGNRMCTEFENVLYVFPVFPNPSTEVLTVDWIARAVGTVRISLTDAIGRAVFGVESSATKGLNHRIIDLSGLQGGLYYLLLEDGTTKNRQRILVSAKP